MRSGARRPPDQEPAGARQEPPAPEPPVLDLQRPAGNAAVARVLQRQPYLVTGDTGTAQKVLADRAAATQAVRDWFDAIAKPHEEAGKIPGSIAELVHKACELPYTRADGTQGTVRDKVKPIEVEQQLRGRARSKGMRLTEHRDPSDLGGVKSELEAMLANLGVIPTSVELGDDDARWIRLRCVGDPRGPRSTSATATSPAERSRSTTCATARSAPSCSPGARPPRCGPRAPGSTSPPRPERSAA